MGKNIPKYKVGERVFYEEWFIATVESLEGRDYQFGQKYSLTDFELVPGASLAPEDEGFSTPEERLAFIKEGRGDQDYAWESELKPYKEFQ